MISKNDIKLIRSLEQKKKRDLHGLFVVEGEKLVIEALNCHAPVHKIISTGNPREWQVRSRGAAVEQATARDMEQISMLATPPGVVALVRVSPPELSLPALARKRVLVLDAIRDPGNLGTIIRSADWFGVSDILASNDTVDCYNPKVVQSTMGSLFRVRVHYTDILQTLAELKALDPGFAVHGATLTGQPSAMLANSSYGAVVIGNESAGISEAVLRCCDRRITIPRIGEAESLNAGVSASILLYEWCISPRSSQTE